MSRRSEARAVIAALLAGLALLAPAMPTRADVPALLNSLRTQGCGRIVGAPALKTSTLLNDAARAMARGTKLQPAVEGTGYAAARSGALHLKGPANDGELRRELMARACAEIGDPRYTEVGAFQRGNETWLVFAAPQPKAPVLDPGAQAARVLALVNAARSTARRCGRQRFEPAPPVKASAILTNAATAHARDMAAHATLDHRGSDGSTPDERVSRAGYRWRATGENVASGQRDADAVVAAWLESPGHCANIMAPGFTEMGVAFALVPGGNPGIYWAQSFGTPR